MSQSPTRSFHASAWTLVALTPVFYVLSVPPVSLLTAEERTDIGYVPREWAYRYAEPYDWLRTFELMAEPLTKYHSWWFDLTAWMSSGAPPPVPPNGPSPFPAP